MTYTADRKLPTGPMSAVQLKRADVFYQGQLRRVARIIGQVTDTAVPGDDYTPEQIEGLTATLKRYAKTLEPWARIVGEKMIHEVNRLNRRNWMAHSAEMGRLLRAEIATAPTGIEMQALLAEQVALITSLPLEAAQRVHKLTLEGIVQGTRASEISAKIRENGEVAKARADCIARTEIGRTSTTLTKVRAQSVGSTEFVWRTSDDAQVRPSHRALNGKVFRWDSPPVCDPPAYRALPGCIWNCRCVSEPVIPTSIFDRYRRIA